MVTLAAAVAAAQAGLDPAGYAGHGGFGLGYAGAGPVAVAAPVAAVGHGGDAHDVDYYV